MVCRQVCGTGVLPRNIVGHQYADRSSGLRQVVWPVPAAVRLFRVVAAFVVALPTKLCSCEAPGMFGNTIGSLVARWCRLQLTWNSWCVTRSSAWAELPVAAV